MKIEGRGLAGAMLAVLLFIVGLFGVVISAVICQDNIQSRLLLDFFGGLLYFVSSFVALFLAIRSGALIKQGRQKIIIRILFLCFTVPISFLSIVILFVKPDPASELFIVGAPMIMYFFLFFLLERLTYATIEDKNSKIAQSLWKESVYAPGILFAVLVFLYILYIFSHL